MSIMGIVTNGVHGIDYAILGARNPMNSWDRSDSDYINFEVGPKDLILMQNLTKSGSEHCKYLRQIQVWADVNMPRYWWSEADTYKFGTKNSCSTMHKLFQKDKVITPDMFHYHEDDEHQMLSTIAKLNQLNIKYYAEKDALKRNLILTRAKQLLPEGFLQMRTWNTNYAELMNMYHQRKGHRLKFEWVGIFCGWCETLPYFKEFCIEPFESKLKVLT